MNGFEKKDDELAKLPEEADEQIEKNTDGSVDRIVRYISDKFSKVTPEEQAEKEKIDGLKKGIRKEVDAMVKTDSNIYLLFMRALEKTGASSEIWEFFRQYLDKGLAQEEKLRYSIPPNIDYRSFAHVKDVFENVQNAELLRTFLRILMESDENQFALLMKWQTYHENDVNKILDLHQGVLLAKARNPEHFRRLMNFGVNDIAPTYDQLVLYLEYLAQTENFDSGEVRNYIEKNLHRKGPYR